MSDKMPDDSRAKARQTARRWLGTAGVDPDEEIRILSARGAKRVHSLADLILSERADERRERDAKWAKALDPQNVGTDYGDFLSDPERAALLIKERESLAIEERDSLWEKAVQESCPEKHAHEVLRRMRRKP